MLMNPNWGITNFDNFGYSFLQVFQCVTMEGWAEISNMVQRAFSPWFFLLFLCIIIIGSFFLINLTLAIIKVKFSEAKSKRNNELSMMSKKNKRDETWPLKKLKFLGVYSEDRRRTIKYKEMIRNILLKCKLSNSGQAVPEPKKKTKAASNLKKALSKASILAKKASMVVDMEQRTNKDMVQSSKYYYLKK
jgi:hypothetical protein